MALFDWTEKFMLGIPEIDEQHKKIVDLINNLSDLRNKGTDNEGLDELINELISYTKTHLSYEENLLKQHEYPEFASHKSNHEQLTKQAVDIQKRYFLGNSGLSVEIAILLNDWLAEHILVEDKKYAPYLKNKGTTYMDRMEKIKDILVGIEELDNQHIEIYDLFNSIMMAKEKNNEEEVMDNVEKLLEIWEKYFKYEDDLMEQYKYSSCDEHKKEHDDFRESILTLKKMYSKGFKYVLNTLAISLNQWVEEHIKHIAGKDRELGKFLNSKGVT